MRSATAAMSGTLGVAFPAMKLPRLASAIPRNIVPRKVAYADASIARFLLEAGAVQERDIPDTWDSVLDVCQNALDAWVKRELGPLHCLSPAFVLDAVGDTNLNPYKGGRQKAASNEPMRYHSVEIGWHETAEQQWVVGSTLEAMEQACAGLGQAVLDILQQQSCHVYPVFTPDQACYQASNLYWMGEDSEDAVLDMECATDEEKDAMRVDMVTKQELTESFPSWAISLPCQKPRPKVKLRSLYAKITDPVHRAIAADALALSKLENLGGYEPQAEGEYLGWGALLSWNTDDVTVRVYDDMVNYAYQSEFHDRIGELTIALDAPQNLQSWQQAMQVRFKAICLIDRLIYQLAEPH